MTFSDVTRAFCALATTPQFVSEWMELLERYVVLLYDRTSSQTLVNQARKDLFTLKGRAIDGLPPTKEKGSIPSWSLLGTGNGSSS